MNKQAKWQCKDCLYYEPKGKDWGVCHRYAPRPSNPLEKIDWTVVSQNDYCGDFEQMPERGPYPAKLTK